MKKSVNLKNILYSLSTILLIFNSGSMIVISNREIFGLLFFLITILLFSLEKRKVKQNELFKLLFFIFLLMLNYIYNIKSGPLLHAYFYIISFLITTFLYCNTFTIDKFEYYFIKNMHLLNILGLFFLIIGLILFNYGYVQMSTTTKNGIFIGPFLYSTTGIQWRNANIFWEPGAYQLFINIQLILLLKNYKLKEKKVFYIIAVISLITTFSTTGYITLTFLVLMYIWKHYKQQHIKNKVLSFIPIFIIIITAVSLLYNTVTISGKFDENNISRNIRFEDFVESLDVMKNIGISIIFGVGNNNEMVKATGSNSVGILVQLLRFGLIYTIFFIVSMYNKIKKCYSNQILMICITLILSYFTEYFSDYPIYMLFLFSFENNRYENDFKFL